MSGAISAPATTATSAASSTSATNALTALSGNFNDFLNLLLTQLQHQDPSSPMDTNTFTSELVQFSSVEQQITTNASLTSLIQATQGSEVIQATGVVGKQVTLNTAQVPLQNGSATVNFTTANAEPIAISLTNSSGVDVKDVSLTSNAGSNTWNWDGADNNGSRLPDGAYTATVTGSSGGATAPVPFTVSGTATGVTNTNGTINLQVGPVSTGFSNVVSVGS